jgi:SAM-dependent methyltransferase
MTDRRTALARREREKALLARFDETAYLRGYADVAQAVASGALASGLDHFTRFGMGEGRNPCPVDRRARLLGGLDVARLRGAEIGVLNQPTVRKHEGDVLYIDHADRAGIAAQYRHAGTDEATLCDVDVVWSEGKLTDRLPDGRKLDYVVASHVIEHVPDLLRWLQHLQDALAPGGQLRLAIPDRRYSFDFLRRETELADVLDAYVRRASAPLPRFVMDFVLQTREVPLSQAWSGEIDRDALARSQDPSPAGALSLARDVLEGRYIDVHCWVFTPRSFAGLMEALARAGMLRLACAEFHDTAFLDREFFVALHPEDDAEAAARSWREAPARTYQDCAKRRRSRATATGSGKV